MINVFENSSEIEKAAKHNYAIPDFIMMENAASSICDFIKNLSTQNTKKSLLVFCGKGNNGGDGLAVARKLQNDFNVNIFCPIEPTAPEALSQYTMCRNLSLPFLNKDEYFEKCKTSQIILDCLYGTGFHGEINSEAKEFLDAANNSDALRIACDIPSAYYFNADVTITMGEYKIELLSDKAKNCCGEIIVANLGLSEEAFTKTATPVSKIIEETDIKLPYRKEKSSHKGKFGHTVVFAGEKSGAGIIAATAALNFGTGLSSVLETEKSNLSQFKISPELMIAKQLPPKTSAVLIGSGLGTPTDAVLSNLKNWMHNTKTPACVIDADMFSFSELPKLLTELNSIPNARIILTPHIKELNSLFKALNYDFSDEDLFDAKKKIILGKQFTKQFQNITLVMKSANTFIATKDECYICQDGNQSLAKAGSGDVLAGMIAALLAQGYSSKEAAITAVEAHALASTINGFENSYFLTPEKLIDNLKAL